MFAYSNNGKYITDTYKEDKTVEVTSSALCAEDCIRQFPSIDSVPQCNFLALEIVFPSAFDYLGAKCYRERPKNGRECKDGFKDFNEDTVKQMLKDTGHSISYNFVEIIRLGIDT